MQLPLGRVTAALIAIIAVAAVAASLPIVVETPSDSGTGAEDGVPEVDEPETEPVGPNSAVIMRALGLVALVLVVLALLAFVLHDRRELLRMLVTVSAVVAAVIIGAFLFLQLMDAVSNNPREPPRERMPNGTLEGSSESEGGSGSSRSPVLSTAEVVGLATVVLGLVLLGLVIRYRLLGPDDDTDEDLSTTADVGSVAGETADQIERESVTSVENAVYDAWYRMTAYLSVENPDTSTPGEFAEAAVDAGLDRDDVEALTSLFEAVRYGPETASDVTERRAVEILRRIESAYADPETPDAEGSNTEELPGPEGTPSASTETAADASTDGSAPDPTETEPHRDGDDR